uniref:Uncharacterized protein n=1 Tax=Arundo donax TaxID=35708 RepID=A0A0A9BMS1_ARUDO
MPRWIDRFNYLVLKDSSIDKYALMTAEFIIVFAVPNLFLYMLF